MIERIRLPGKGEAAKTVPLVERRGSSASIAPVFAGSFHSEKAGPKLARLSPAHNAEISMARPERFERPTLRFVV